MRKQCLSVMVIVFALALTGCSSTSDIATPQIETVSEDVFDTESAVKNEETETTSESEAHKSTNLCLTGGEFLYQDGYTQVKQEYDEVDGSYFDKYISEDAIQTIYEKGVTDYNNSIAVEDYMLEEATKLAGDAEVKNTSIEKSTCATGISYPACVAKFYSGNNEDTTSWVVYIVDTDNGLFMYGLSCAADYDDGMFRDADKVFPKLTIRENYRGVPSTESATAKSVSTTSNASMDLMDYFGASINDAIAVIAGLEQDGAQYSVKDEKAADGLALAGPFIDVDANGNIIGITYSGKTYSVESLMVGADMAASGQSLKGSGWEFQNVGFAHGTAQYVVTYAKGNVELILVSDKAGDFSKSEESDVTGNIATISVYNK